jgi:hypothetical protein
MCEMFVRLNHGRKSLQRTRCGQTLLSQNMAFSGLYRSRHLRLIIGPCGFVALCGMNASRTAQSAEFDADPAMPSSAPTSTSTPVPVRPAVASPARGADHLDTGSVLLVIAPPASTSLTSGTARWRPGGGPVAGGQPAGWGSRPAGVTDGLGHPVGRRIRCAGVSAGLGVSLDVVINADQPACVSTRFFSICHANSAM